MIKMMIFCTMAFAFCWLPLNTVTIIGDQRPEIWRYKHIMLIWITSHWLAMSHCSYNPIIYFTMNTKFRTALRHLIRLVLCQTQLNQLNPISERMTLATVQYQRNNRNNAFKFSSRRIANN
jgi:neuropeptide Y receptor